MLSILATTLSTTTSTSGTYPTSSGRSPIFIGKNSGPVGAEGPVNQGVGAWVCAGVQEEELLDAVVNLVVRLGCYPEPEKNSQFILYFLQKASKSWKQFYIK